MKKLNIILTILAYFAINDITFARSRNGWVILIPIVVVLAFAFLFGLIRWCIDKKVDEETRKANLRVLIILFVWYIILFFLLHQQLDRFLALCILRTVILFFINITSN